MLSVVMSMDSIKESVRLLSLSRISLDTFALPLRDLCPASLADSLLNGI